MKEGAPMARQDDRTPHWAIEEFERRYIGTSLTEQEREEPFWPYGTARLYGYTPQYLAPGPRFDPRYRGRGPRNYKRPRERILDDVAVALTREPDLDASDITVDVNDECDVILGGEAGHKAEKRLAEDLAADVWGVRDVHNHIHVRRPY
jgi:BON domain-containing protein